MRKQLLVIPEGFPCSLADCPPGLFLKADQLCFKSEYNGEAFTDSGEMFWGGISTREERDRIIVQPCVYRWHAGV